jgi:serine/threonine protein kinase
LADTGIVPDSVPPQTALEPGVVLDRYELLCTIARGGMAHVWLGRFKGKHGFEKLVAVKTILPEHALDERFRKMFLDEARIASGVEHPNVAKILDLGEWRDFLYLVMEYVDGDALSRLRRTLDRRGVKMPVPLVLRILSDICSGLHSAHELRGEDGAPLGVVHRDVSPQNVLISHTGVSKLIDFGVAKARDRLGEETGAGFAKGKSRYMAPEQALAKPVDRRSDIFALGAMAYEVFEGQAPYDGPNDMARLHSLITGDEIKAVKHAPHPAVEKLILKALARDPDARFSTAAEMRTAIEDAMVQLKVRAGAEEVGAFVTEHTGERVAERKRVVKLALDAAVERQRIKDMLEQGTVSGRRGHSSPDEASPDGVSAPAPDAPASPEKASSGEAGAESAVPPAYSSTLHERDQAIARRRWGLIAVAALLGIGAVIGIGALIGHKSSSAVAAATVDSVASPPPPTAPPQNTAIPPPPATSASPIGSAPASAATMSGASSARPTVIHHPRPHPTARPSSTGKNGKNPHDVVIQ